MDKKIVEQLQAEFERLGYKWEGYHFIGIRSKANLSNQFDDLFCIVNNDKLQWFTCTTNPGTHWLKNLLNPSGTALLKPAQYLDGYKIGLHQGKYEAFIQNKPVTVYRDKDLDEVAEETATTETGFFGINIHRTNDTGVVSKLIDKWSAGCQVLNNPADFKTLLESAKATKKPTFTYTLLKEF